MSIALDHTIVHARNADATADFLVRILDLPAWTRLAHFRIVRVGETSLDVLETDEQISSRHFAFRVPEAEFDAVMNRIMKEEIPFSADPFHRLQGQINAWGGGRGVYFDDPNGHVLEVLTKSYDSAGLTPQDYLPLPLPQS